MANESIVNPAIPLREKTWRTQVAMGASVVAFGVAAYLAGAGVKSILVGLTVSAVTVISLTTAVLLGYIGK